MRNTRDWWAWVTFERHREWARVSLRNTRDWWAWVTFGRHRDWAKVKLEKHKRFVGLGRI